MNKAEILDAIRSFAAANRGKAPGSQRLATEIGLRKVDWYPKFWVRWSDAVREAGLRPNLLSVATPDEVLIAKYVGLIREFGRFPIESDLLLKRQNDEGFPDRGVFSRLGSKRERAGKALDYYRQHPAFSDLIPICEVVTASSTPRDRAAGATSRVMGYVYLMKHGNRAEYKIGRMFNPVRREGEMRLELPETLRPVHHIKTDDPAGVEAYWHR
jgi:hypothetical protein